MKYMKILETLVNLGNVAYVEKKEEDGYFSVELSFVNGAMCINRFETQEEQEALFNEIVEKIAKDG